MLTPDYSEYSMMSNSVNYDYVASRSDDDGDHDDDGDDGDDDDDHDLFD